MDTSDDEFPLHDGGKVVFKRDWFIKQTATLVLDKKMAKKYGSYYWRAPFGAGKSVFLKLIGRELQGRGCDVYLTSSMFMEKLHEDYFSKLAYEAGDKTVVLMVDEVQNNISSEHWFRILKGSKPVNLLVLGVGIPLLNGFSPQFDEKYPKGSEIFPMFLTIDDLPEVRDHFIKKMFRSEEFTAIVCERLLEFTAGHTFAFVKFATHVLDLSSGIDDLRNLDSYLVSAKFSNSIAYKEVRDRCFAFLTGTLLTAAQAVLLNADSIGDRVDLEKQGIWNRDVGFISPLVYSLVFSGMKSSPVTDPIILDESEAARPAAEQIICAGLRDMTDASFMDTHYDMVAVENAVGFQWGYNVRRNLSDVCVAPQVRIVNQDHKTRVPKPAIDYFFNGRLNLGIELALNQNAAGVREHLERFDSHYKRYGENGVVLHLQTKNENPITDLTAPFDTEKAKNRIYTFSKVQNALYRGKTLVRANVVRHLSSPSTKSYSTYVSSCMRKAVMILK